MDNTSFMYPLSTEMLLCEAEAQGMIGNIIKPNISDVARLAYDAAFVYYQKPDAKLLSIDVPVRIHRVLLGNEILISIVNSGSVKVQWLMDRIKNEIFDEAYNDRVNEIVDEACQSFVDKFEGVINKVGGFDDYLTTFIRQYTAIWN